MRYWKALCRTEQCQHSFSKTFKTSTVVHSGKLRLCTSHRFCSTSKQTLTGFMSSPRMKESLWISGWNLHVHWLVWVLASFIPTIDFSVLRLPLNNPLLLPYHWDRESLSRAHQSNSLSEYSLEASAIVDSRKFRFCASNRFYGRQNQV